MSFKDNFKWGAATAAYQIEGAVDSRGPSIWDQFSHWPGKTVSGDTGDVACDHYRRMTDDVELMSSLGLKSYRFSVSWPRILPAGTGAVNAPGLDFYDRLVDALLDRDIAPWITLFHWDLPLELYYRGGWLNAESAEWFAEYAGILAEKLGDRVKDWITFNEPDMFVSLGHSLGVHAPGLKLPPADIVRIIHNVHRSHGRAVTVLRDAVPECRVAMAPALAVIEPEGEDMAEAARTAQFGVAEGELFSFSNSVWNDPTFFKRYPEEYLRRYARHLPSGWEEDLAGLPDAPDFIGVNIYQAVGRMVAGADGAPEFRPSDQYGPGFPRSNFMWPVTPGALYWGPKFLWERYGKPVAITENGMSSHDWVQTDGRVDDPARRDFAARYLAELRRAAAGGVDIDAYFHWSLMDNFEWAEGYRHRFGLIHVDFATGNRTVKESGHWYRGVIESNGANLS
jgi:beta-glucosidase